LKRPLLGRRVLVMRAEGQAGEAVELLRGRGAEAVVVPTLVIGPPNDPAPAEQALLRLSGHASYDWVAFTSANGVEHAWNLAARAGVGREAFAGARIAAVGPGTAAALGGHGLSAQLIAKESTGEGLAGDMLLAMGNAARVLLLRAEVARDALPDALLAGGCSVDVVAVYKTRAAEGLAGSLRSLFEPPAIDAALLTSSSTVTHVKAALGAETAALFARIRVASIGPVTTETAKAQGIRVDAEALPYTLAALVAALEATFIGER
jgi:uroporphyrinogen III methyltransferase / synthase